MRAVLDTNVVLDWLVFDDSLTQALQVALHARRISLVANALVHEELRRVLAYPQLKLDASRQLEVHGRYRSATTAAPLPDKFSRDNLLLPLGFPRCRDSDDDHFLALAFHANASLVTKDKALLKLRKRAIRFHVPILNIRDLNLILQ